MNNAITYCNQWSRRRSRPAKVWTEDQAQKAHDKGDLYTVVYGDIEKPSCFIEISFETKYVGVFFLDNLQRIWREHMFKDRQGRLFLVEILERKFQDESKENACAKRYFLSIEGDIVIHNIDIKTNETERRELKEVIETMQLWEDYPQFGQYESISRVDRGINLDIS